jgi:hypothetical protein
MKTQDTKRNPDLIYKIPLYNLTLSCHARLPSPIGEGGFDFVGTG